MDKVGAENIQCVYLILLRDFVSECIKDVRERARFAKDSELFRAFLEGLPIFNRITGMKEGLEELEKHKIYISKLSTDEKFFRVHKTPKYKGYFDLVHERTVFLNSFARFILVYYICILGFVLEMGSFEVFQVKQAVIDILEYYSAYIDRFDPILPRKTKKMLKSVDVGFGLLDR